MSDHFQQTVDSLFQGMENFITTKTVVGEAVHVGDTILIPLVDVTFGMAASAKAETNRRNGGGGMGGKISPSAVLMIQNGNVRLINVKNQDGLTKVIDMAPDLINRFMPGKRAADPEVKKAAEDVSSHSETF